MVCLTGLGAGCSLVGWLFFPIFLQCGISYGEDTTPKREIKRFQSLNQEKTFEKWDKIYFKFLAHAATVCCNRGIAGSNH